MELFALARAPRERLPDLPARRLFIRAPLASNTPAGLDDWEVPVIDESVYSRNRCFRLLFNAKFGQRAALMLSRLGGGSGTRGGLCGNSGTDGVAQAVAWSSPMVCCNICSMLEKVCAPKNEPV